MKYLIYWLLPFCFLQLEAQTKSKDVALQEIRQIYAEKPFRKFEMKPDSVDKYKALWNEQGVFSDLRAAEDEIITNNYASQADKQVFISSVTGKAFQRLWMIAETYRNTPHNISDPDLQLLLRSVLHYGRIENDRINANTRWHTSCFAIPVASTHIYFSLFDLMSRIEKGVIDIPFMREVNDILGKLSFQSWSVPARHDETDNHIVNVERFRKHVWWVGGNATGYRPLLAAAAQLSSCEMADVVGEVAVRSISSVSQTTYDNDFWVEGITADGAGWGHGLQCLVWGYPIHGTVGSFDILETMKNYPLPVSLEREQMYTIRDFIRGSSYYYYKGYVPPVVDRGNMNRLETPYPGRKGNKATGYRYEIPSLGMVRMILDKFPDKLDRELKDEFTQFSTDAPSFRIGMKGKWESHYSGSRYFFNNDDLIKKTDDYYLLVNMASNRVSGLESARTMAAAFNIFTCDGTTLFFRKGDEYQRVMGAFNLRTWAGTTSRMSLLPLNPIENWHGYNSLHPFAAGATFGEKSFAGGFIFEKNNRKWQSENIPFNIENDPNPSAFGVKAYKSYFMFDDVFLALGCGIENKMPEWEGDIVTTIDQTALHGDFLDGETFRNNGFYYTVWEDYSDGKVVSDYGKKKTQWQKMCVENKLPETEEDIFHLYINHGPNPQNASYAYTVCCDENALSQKPVIWSNTKQIQAAESYDNQTLGAVFYEAEQELKYGNGFITASAPCALLVERKENKIRLSVTDGLMNASLKEIYIRTSFPVRGKNVMKHSDSLYEIKVTMPDGRYTGAPAILNDIQLID